MTRTRSTFRGTESTDNTETSNITTTKSRRSHRKSRNGCIECKHRHIRCDERQPSCANCELAERLCSFLTPQVDKQNQNRDQRLLSKQRRRSGATASVSVDFEAHGNTDTRSPNKAEGKHVEQPSPFLRQSDSHLDLDQAIDQLFHRSLPIHCSHPPDTGLSARLHQIPSLTSPMQLDDIQTPRSECCPGLLTTPGVEPKALFTPQHMILLHHAGTVPNMTGPNNRNAVDIAIRHAIDSPYLIDEVLAFTAFHLAGVYPGSAPQLRRLATELQTRALASFTRITKLVPYDDEATAVPRFLFSGILGRHVLADALLYCRSDFHSFIDRLVECINLNRGIRAVTPPARYYLYNSELQPFLSVMREAEEKIISPGNECDALSCLMDGSDLNEVSIEACRQAIVVLQWSFDICRGLSEDEYPQSASAFSVRIEANFVDVLRKHRPEALVILAYYGVLLYRCRSFWAFENAGASMIRAIAGQLGSYWQEALAWPLHVLEEERNSEQLIPASTNNVVVMPSNMSD